MDILSSLAMGFAAALTPINLMWGFIGCLLGTAIGVLPGIGPALTVALLLPITAKVDPTGALIMFAGIYYGAQFGGSTTSILLNTPGESSSMVTALEGNLMARNGRAGPALATAAIGSFVAGTIATILLTLFAPDRGQAGAEFRPDGVFRDPGAVVHHGVGGARRLDAARLRLAGRRADHRPDRPGLDLGHCPLHPGRARTGGRHRGGAGGGGFVRGRRGLVQPALSNGIKRRAGIA